MFTQSTIKNIISRARNRITTLANKIKNKDINQPKSMEEYQQYLKESNKKFRRYNRKSKQYEPIIPCGKLKQSDEYNEFILDTNEYLNTSLSARAEQEKQDIMREYGISEDVFDLAQEQSIDVSQYSSDDNVIKHLHVDNAIKKYNIDIYDNEQMKVISDIERNIDKYDIRDVYDIISGIKDNKNGVIQFENVDF